MRARYALEAAAAVMNAWGAVAREAARARMMGIITAEGDDDTESDDGEGGYPRHVYHVTEIIIPRCAQAAPRSGEWTQSTCRQRRR